MTRRSFLQRTSTGIALSLTAPTGLLRGPAAVAETNDVDHEWEYSFPVLGDIHYDDMSHHDMEWVMREKPKDLRQIEGYVEVTKHFTPRLLDEIAHYVKNAATPVPFVVQVGDYTEGLCGSFELQSKQFRDACQAYDDARVGTPLLITKGNHDITGPGASDAYDRVLLPWMSKQAKQPIAAASYVRRQGEDLFVFFDAYKPDMDWLESTLLDEPARYTFFVVHPPIVPYNARANWHLFSKPREQQDRERLLKLLGERNAIVLGGHLHKYSILQRQCEHGSFTQLAVNSVIRGEKSSPRQLLESGDDYGSGLLELNPDFSPNTLEDRRQWLEHEAPYVSSFEYANTFGYAVIRVAQDQIAVDMFNGLDRELWRSRSLLSLRTATPSA